MPVVFEKRNTQLHYAFEQLDKKRWDLVWQLLREKLVRTVCHGHHAMLYVLEEQSDQKNCQVGARLPFWLNSMMAGLPKYKDTDSRAGSTDSVSSSQQVIP